MSEGAGIDKARRLALLAEAGFRCEKCGAGGAAQDGRYPTLEVHHVLPQHQGGRHERENLQVLCLDCHPRGRPKGSGDPAYPARLPVYDTEEGIRLLKALAGKWECSAAAAIRRLVREAAKREKVD